jgi:hypothetical protein
MAKAKSGSAKIIRLPAAKAPNITIRQAAPKKVKHHRRKGGATGGMSVTDVALAGAASGYVLGYIDKNPGSIPTIPMLGRAGTLALAAWFFRAKHPMLSKMALCFAGIAGYEKAKDGTISGDEGNGWAAGY